MIPIEEYFRYHPVQTPERAELHRVVNKASLSFALDITSLDQYTSVLRSCIKDEECLSLSLANAYLAYALAGLDPQSPTYADDLKDAFCSYFSVISNVPSTHLIRAIIQQSRMFANQGITIDSLPNA